MSVTTGQRLGRYRLGNRVGSGGMADVWEAQDESLHRTVAIKVILEAVSREPTFTERFVREARTIAGLEHPNILPIYDFGQEGESVYLVMPLVAKGSLKDRLSANVPAPQALEWISGLASALDYAHSHGVVHRDVKPANVLIDMKGRPLLSDFGLAKSAGDSIAGLTATGSVMGTPAYMSPEQAMGQRLDGRSDQYSLGIIAFQLLAGVVPFKADSPLVVLNKHLQEVAPRPSGLNPKLSPAVDRAIERALRKNPAERYACCEEFAAALAQAFGASAEADQATSKWSSAESVLEPSSSRGAREPSEDVTGVIPRRRRRMLGMAAAAGAVLLVTAVALSWRSGAASNSTVALTAPTIVPAPVPRETSRPAPTPPLVVPPSPSPQQAVAKTPIALPAPTALPTAVPTPRLEPTAAPAAPPPLSGTLWTSFFDAGQKAFGEGDFQRAEKLFRDAVSEAERFGTKDPRLARSVQRLGSVLANLGRLSEAEVLLRRSLAMRAAQPSDPAMDLADNQVNLGFVLAREGKAGAGEAEALVQRALAAKEKALGPSDPAVAFVLQQLAYCYEMQSRHVDAEPLLERALAIYDATPGAHEPGRAAVLNDLGWMYMRKGQPEQAEPRLREALSVRQRVLPPNHPAVAQSLVNLAQAKTAQKEYSQAELLLTQALAIREKSLGQNNLAVAQTLEELARVLRSLRRAAEADQLLARAREIRARNEKLE